MSFDVGFCPTNDVSSLIPGGGSGISWGRSTNLNVAGGALALAGLINEWDLAESVLSAISFGSSWRWYLKLTQFESLFVMFILLEVFVGRYLGFFPFSMHDFFLGKPNGKRRKRRALMKPGLNDNLINGLLKLLRKLDDQECFPKSLCIMEAESARGKRIPEGVTRFLAAVKLISSYSEKDSESSKENNSATRLSSQGENFLNGFSIYTDAVEVGVEDGKSGNSSLCETKYRGCTLPRDDALYYYEIISSAGLAK